MTDSVRIDCERALELLAAYLDGELPALDEHTVRQHLEQCHSCYSRAEFEHKLKSRLAQLRSADVGAGLEARIRTLLAGQTNT
ncbi:MAG: anti-sigma factor family protein [Longimicrobiales bacterium]